MTMSALISRNLEQNMQYFSLLYPVEMRLLELQPYIDTLFHNLNGTTFNESCNSLSGKIDVYHDKILGDPITVSHFLELCKSARYFTESRIPPGGHKPWVRKIFFAEECDDAFNKHDQSVDAKICTVPVNQKKGFMNIITESKAMPLEAEDEV